MYKRTFLFSLVTSLAYAAPMPESGPTCPVDGNIVCSSDGCSFSMCVWGFQVPLGNVADGTFCKDGVIGYPGSGDKFCQTGTKSIQLPLPADALTKSVPAPSSAAPAQMAMTSSSTALPTGMTTIPEPVMPTSIPSKEHNPSKENNPPMEDKPMNDEKTTTYTQTTTRVSHVTSVVTVKTGHNSMPTGSYPAPPSNPNPGSYGVTAQQLLAIAPMSSTCSGAPFPEECSTAEHAVPFINAAFAKYGITSKGAKAAVLSLMAFETGDFKYNINHFPGRPGQGTRNLMMYPFVYQYVKSIPALASKIPAGVTETTATDDQKNQVRALVLGDDYTWATGAWYLKTVCQPQILKDLAKGDEASWSNYITSCVQTTVTDDRKKSWQAAINAL